MIEGQVDRAVVSGAQRFDLEDARAARLQGVAVLGHASSVKPAAFRFPFAVASSR